MNRISHVVPILLCVISGCTTLMPAPANSLPEQADESLNQKTMGFIKFEPNSLKPGDCCLFTKKPERETTSDPIHFVCRIVSIDDDKFVVTETHNLDFRPVTDSKSPRRNSAFLVPLLLKCGVIKKCGDGYRSIQSPGELLIPRDSIAQVLPLDEESFEEFQHDGFVRVADDFETGSQPRTIYVPVPHKYLVDQN